MDYKSLGERIKAVRKQQGMTQQLLAELIEKSVQHISHIETGNTKASLEVLVNIANVLGVTADELLSESIEKFNEIYTNEISKIVSGCTNKELRFLSQLLYTSVILLRNFPCE